MALKESGGEQSGEALVELGGYRREISIGLLVAGGVYLAYLLVFNREVLETEPGDVNVFTH